MKPLPPGSTWKERTTTPPASFLPAVAWTTSTPAGPMAEACIRTGTHYLDITGEIEVFEALASMGDAAKKADVMLMPGTGFDIVPTDCLAAHRQRLMPAAT